MFNLPLFCPLLQIFINFYLVCLSSDQNSSSPNLDLFEFVVNISRLLSAKFPAEMKDQLPRKTVWNLMFCIGTAAVVALFAAIYILKQVSQISVGRKVTHSSHLLQLKIILSNMTDSEKEHFSIIREWKSFIGGDLGNFRKI